MEWVSKRKYKKQFTAFKKEVINYLEIYDKNKKIKILEFKDKTIVRSFGYLCIFEVWLEMNQRKFSLSYMKGNCWSYSLKEHNYHSKYFGTITNVLALKQSVTGCLEHFLNEIKRIYGVK